MNHKLFYVALTFASFLIASVICAQDDMLNDPDLKKALKDAEELPKAGVVDKPLNNFSNDVSSNGNVTTRLFVSTRTDPEQKVGWKLNAMWTKKSRWWKFPIVFRSRSWGED